jgi:hypothetical protein
MVVLLAGAGLFDACRGAAPPRSDDSQAPLTADAPAHTRQATVKTFSAAELSPLVPPNRDFTLAVPPGWNFANNAAENPIYVAPSGQTLPNVQILALIPVSALKAGPTGLAGVGYRCGQLAVVQGMGQFYTCYKQALVALEGRQWSAQESVEILRAHLRQAGVTTSDLRTYPLGPDKLVATGTFRGRETAEGVAFLQMLYVPDSTLVAYASALGIADRPPPLWISYANIALCETPPGQLAEFMPLCRAILSSFKPGPTWLVAYIREQFQQEAEARQLIMQAGQQSLASARQTTQMIASTGEAVRNLQYQTFATIMREQLHSDKQWIDAFGGSVTLTDPASGKLYTVQTNWQTFDHYCLVPGGASVVVGNGALPPSNCGTRLKPID